MAHELIEKWRLLTSAATEEEKDRLLFEFWQAMDVAEFWVEVEELGGDQIGLVKSDLESAETSVILTYIGEDKGERPSKLQDVSVPFREATGHALLKLASDCEVGLVLIDDNGEHIYLEWVTVRAFAGISQVVTKKKQHSSTNTGVIIGISIFFLCAILSFIFIF